MIYIHEDVLSTVVSVRVPETSTCHSTSSMQTRLTMSVSTESQKHRHTILQAACRLILQWVSVQC